MAHKAAIMIMMPVCCVLCARAPAALGRNELFSQESSVHHDVQAYNLDLHTALLVPWSGPAASNKSDLSNSRVVPMAQLGLGFKLYDWG